MFKLRKKIRNTLLTFLLCICAIIFALSAIIVSQKAFAYTTANMPTDDSAIGNLVSSIDSNGKVKFDNENLKKLAQKGGYDSFQKMVNAAEGGTIKTSEDFGNISVNLGSYEFGGTTRELTWIPVYLSQADREGSDKKDAILTLWLAGTEKENGEVSNQEVSTWSDGTYTTKATEQSWNGSSVYSNAYYSSYIRNYVLNGNDDYTTWSGGTLGTKPPTDTMTKFSLFTGSGSLVNYIVKPSAVSWQKNAAYQRNDPEWSGTGAAKYPNAWMNDNLWLPSIYETFDNTITVNCTKSTFTENGGLWQTGNGSSSREKRSNASDTWLRSARYDYYHNAFNLAANGSSYFHNLDWEKAVRPALHLNLSMLSSCNHKLTSHPQVTYCDKDGHEAYWECSECDGLFSDPEAKNSIDKIVTIDPTGHDYPEEWSSNDTKHWHVCANDCGVKGSEENHTWDSGTVTEQPSCTKLGKKLLTCTTCQKTKTEDVPKTEHTYSNEWKYDATNHWHECMVCKAVQPNSSVAHSGGSADCQNKATCSICSQEYGGYGAHTEVDDDAVSATCTETGKTAGKHCSKCNEITVAQSVTNALGHNYEAAEGGVAPTCTTTGSGKVKCSRCDDEKVGDSIPALGHDWGEWETTKEATFTEDGEKKRECSRCDEVETETIPAKGVSTNEVTLTLNSNFVYGDEISPVITARYGEVVLKWYDTSTGEELAEKPSTLGNYKLVASVEENLEEGYTGVSKEVEFTIAKRKITVTINAGCSEQGSDLEELTATVTSGSIVGEIPYALSTNADKETMGEYTITGTCTNDNYDIKFVDGVYIVSKKAEDPDGNGEIDLPVDINVEFKVTQSQTSSDYSELKGLKTGYWAQLWYRNEDGTLGDEFTDKINCILTLKIPTDIIEGIRGGEEINREKIAAGLKVYYVNGDGEFVGVDNFKIAQKEDESWIIKFNYNEKFRAEVVFNAENVEEPAEEPESSGIPWWVWLIVGLVGVAIVGVVIIIIVVVKKKNGDNSPTDNGELLSRLDSQEQKIDELLGRDDGGFNTPVELDENGNVIFK